MAIKIRKSKSQSRFCEGCPDKRNVDGVDIYEIYIGNGRQGHIHKLCTDCMHELLQKMIIIGAKHNGV
jgi:hypothetical protein